MPCLREPCCLLHTGLSTLLPWQPNGDWLQFNCGLPPNFVCCSGRKNAANGRHRWSAGMDLTAYLTTHGHHSPGALTSNINNGKGDLWNFLSRLLNQIFSHCSIKDCLPKAAKNISASTNFWSTLTKNIQIIWIKAVMFQVSRPCKSAQDLTCPNVQIFCRPSQKHVSSLGLNLKRSLWIKSLISITAKSFDMKVRIEFNGTHNGLVC